MESSLKLVPEKEIAWLILDLAGEKVNKLSTPVMNRLREILESLHGSSFKALIIISEKPGIFIAGADINEIRAMNSANEFDRAVAGGQEIMNLIEDLPIPVIAAIHGACMGGGTELSLACDYRICTEDPSTKIGLPEIQLGIIPGFGGCVRAPRVLGLQAGIEMVTSAKALKPQKALKTGLVDKVVHPNLLRKEVLRWTLEEIIPKGKRHKRFVPRSLLEKFLESVGKTLVFKMARKEILKATKGHYPAPLKALEVIEKTYGSRDRTSALATERMGFCEMAMTSVSKNLLHVFELTEMGKKLAQVDAKPRKVEKMAVLGAGVMGGGIAQLAANVGVQVQMKDISFEALGKGLKHAQDLFLETLKRKSITTYEFKQKMNAISISTDYGGFKTVDYIVEAIVEDMALKQKVIRETVEKCRPDVIVATNTSSLSVTEMAKGHPRPENFAGMHFFNPVHRMPLVEVIRGEKTSDETVATVVQMCRKMGKTAVVVKDGPGFIVNRLLMPYMAEAVFLLMEGCDIAEVDNAFVFEFGMPMGPFALMDEVGLDTAVKVAKIFSQAFPGRMELPGIMDQIYKSGRLGKKNGSGFYQYDAKGKRLDVDPTCYEAFGLKAPTKPHQMQDCIDRCVFLMINECSIALIDEKIVNTAHEVDLAMIMGTGFPPFRGGLLKYADTLGAQHIASRLDQFAKTTGGSRFQLAPPLRQLVQSGRKFYDLEPANL